MKRIILLLCIAIFSTQLGLSPPDKTLIIAGRPPTEPFKTLLEAVGMVESGNDPCAYNHGEMATGIYQIRPIRILDYNQRTGKNYTLSDCYDIQISKEIFLYYADKKHFSDLENIAKDWNGSGEQTVVYWEKIKSILDNAQ